MNQAVEKERDRRARLLEVFVSVAASAVSSAILVSWVLSATLTRFESAIDEHEQRLVSQQAQLTAITDRGAQTNEKLAAVNAQYADILRRLDGIDRKLEGRR